jgi:hypothetical protein
LSFIITCPELFCIVLVYLGVGGTVFATLGHVLLRRKS